MAEETTVKIRSEQCFFSEEYGWMDAYIEYDVRPDVAERWISEGKAFPAEKKS
jgi:hypothetical protein